MSILGRPAFLLQRDNVLAQAILAASSVLPSNAIIPRRLSRTGHGTINLTGPYTGAANTLIEVDIVATTGSNVVLTTPVFSGAGNGTLEGLSVAPATPAQTFTLTLSDLGSNTQTASLDLGAGQLEAAAAGAGGNSLRLLVNISGLIQTPRNIALLADWPANTEFQLGDQWDFGGLPLQADGTLASATPVLQFGSDPQIFRPYKQFEAGQWQHYLVPAPPRTLPKSTPVYDVSGSLSVTVTDGVTTELYLGITTVYSLLLALGTSALVRPKSTVINDLKPTGAGAQWLSLRTTPYLLPPVNTGSRYVYGLDPSIGTGPHYTQEISVECVDNERIGAERWTVSGSVSGALDDAVTDTDYTSGPVNFTIPLRPYEANGGSLAGSIGGKYSPKDNTNTNKICLHRPIVGALATNKSITFTWVKRPVDTCPCEQGTYVGQPSEECLGLPIPNDPTGGSSVDPEILSRRTALWAWSAEIIGDNNTLSLNSTLATAVLKAIKDDIDFIKDTRDIFDTAINICGTSAASRAVWDTAYTDMLAEIEPLRYIAGAAPAEVATGYQWVADAELVPTLVPSWTGDLTGIYVLPTVRNGCAYRFVTSPLNTFTTGSTEPTWPTTAVGEQVADGDIVWELVEIYWQPTTVYPALHDINVYDGIARTTTLGGTSGATYPAFSAYTATTDGTITWDLTGGPSGYDLVAYAAVNRQYVVQQQGPSYYIVYMIEAGRSIYRGAFNDEPKANAAITRYKAEDATSTRPADPRESFLDKYRELMGAAKIAGGFDPKNDASTSSTGPTGTCWQDTGDEYFWADLSGYYQPIFNGVYYISSYRKTHPDGTVTIESSREFGLAAVAGCPDQLQEGDELVITIAGAGSAKTYQIGDKFTVPIIAAGPAYLTGGQTGNDTHTWTVRGTVAGALPSYAVVNGAELPYGSGGLSLTLRRGGIANALGDKWEFSVLGGQIQWRRDGGAWSGPHDMTPAGLALTDGLSLTFTPNKSPSFVVGERFAWDVIQPYGPSYGVEPEPDFGWRWSGATATLTADLGSALPIDVLGIVHRLPVGASLVIAGSDDNFASTLWSEAIVIDEPVILRALSTPRTQRYLRLSLTAATNGNILWFWTGLATQTYPVQNYTHERVYLRQPQGRSKLLLASGYGATLNYGVLTLDQYQLLLDILGELTETGAPTLYTPSLGGNDARAPVFGYLDTDTVPTGFNGGRIYALNGIKLTPALL